MSIQVSKPTTGIEYPVGVSSAGCQSECRIHPASKGAGILLALYNTESNSESPSGDRSTGWLAQPGGYLYDLSCGFQPQTEMVDCKP